MTTLTKTTDSATLGYLGLLPIGIGGGVLSVAGSVGVLIGGGGGGAFLKLWTDPIGFVCPVATPNRPTSATGGVLLALPSAGDPVAAAFPAYC